MKSFAPRLRLLSLLTMAALAGLLTVTVASSPVMAAVLDPAGEARVEIHKFAQPAALGSAASGLPQDTTGLTPVPGAVFTARLVPGIDLTTTAGQATAASLTADAAASLVAGQPVVASATTNAQGNATLAHLAVGLYYLEETVTPAGFVSAAPFLMALPLTRPDTVNDWLWTVHVYPKNAPVSITLDVVDADAVALGDTVSWQARASIPAHTSIDAFRVEVAIDPRLRLVGASSDIGVSLNCASCPTLISGTHFTTTIAPDGATVTVDFTQVGRALLASTASADPFAAVLVDFETTVLAMGDLSNRATLYPSQSTLDGSVGAPPAVSDDAVTRWGPLGIVVHEVGFPDRLIANAGFQLYLTPQDALNGTHPVTVDGISQWRSDEHGRVTINGLRFSEFVNGLQRDPSDPLFREYYVYLVHVPTGYQGTPEVLAVRVNSTTEAQVVVVQLNRTVPGGGDLPWTGAQVTGASMLTGVLLVSGIVLLLARRRRKPHEQS